MQAHTSVLLMFLLGSQARQLGENHVVVTDDNGQFSTSADWASHKHNTNAGKTSEDGVWFGTSEPDDSKGALPYDTYIIEEMRCDSNKGFELIPPFEIVVSRNNLVIDLGTLTDEYEKEISIHTTATSKDGEKTILAGKEVTIVDTVKLDGLTKGTKYQLKGWQMLKEENAELIIDGKRVENDYTFVADDEEMKVEISYTFNASALGGKNLVTFEELYDLSNPDEPVKVAEHKDIEDDGQTVLITERIIKIHTTATDKDGNKELEAGKEVTIIDTVTLEGLEVGTQYKLVGWQMLKEENAELLINGKRVESDYTFTADSETMKVEVAFTFDATSLDGKQLVTFEELYDLSNPDEPKKVTEHKDIEDKGQTITFKEKPEEPEKPETPPTPEKPNRPSDSPKTGDSTNVMAFIVMLLLLDINLPYENGYEVCRKIKQVMPVPIIFVTSRDTNADELKSIQVGGIDFITKPYDTLILLEKIKRALQLSNPNNFRELVKKDCTLDLHLSILKYQEQSIELTRNEFRILYYFFMNEDKVISKCLYCCRYGVKGTYPRSTYQNDFRV